MSDLAVGYLPESAMQPGMQVLDEAETHLPHLSDAQIALMRGCHAYGGIYDALASHIISEMGNLDSHDASGIWRPSSGASRQSAASSVRLEAEMPILPDGMSGSGSFQAVAMSSAMDACSRAMRAAKFLAARRRSTGSRAAASTYSRSNSASTVFILALVLRKRAIRSISLDLHDGSCRRRSTSPMLAIDDLGERGRQLGQFDQDLAAVGGIADAPADSPPVPAGR